MNRISSAFCLMAVCFALPGTLKGEEVLYHNPMDDDDGYVNTPGGAFFPNNDIALKPYQNGNIAKKVFGGGLRFRANEDLFLNSGYMFGDGYGPLNVFGVAEVVPADSVSIDGLFDNSGYSVGEEEYIEWQIILKASLPIGFFDKGFFEQTPELEGQEFASLVEGLVGPAFIARDNRVTDNFSFQTICFFLTNEGVFTFQDANGRQTVAKVADRRPWHVHKLGMRYDRKLNLMIWKLDDQIVKIYDNPGVAPDSSDGFTTIRIAPTGAVDGGPGADLENWITTGLMTAGYTLAISGVIDNGDGTRTGLVQDEAVPNIIPSTYIYTQEEINANSGEILFGKKLNERNSMTIYDWKVVRGASPGSYDSNDD